MNKDIETRDKLIFGGYEPGKYGGGIRRFSGLDAGKLGLLFQQGFIDPGDRQNAAPTAAEMFAFLCRHPGYTAHGYAVEAKRPDHRVSLEGVAKDHGYDSDEELKDFVDLFRSADGFEAGRSSMFCWFD